MKSISMAAFQLQADVRDDEEQQNKFQECIDLLLAAGYFRARIRGLAPFDKLIGGMVWCIEMCNVDVDVDLFYKDELSIGMKIAVTERIIQVLPLMKCPWRIEPHQIQGLDCVHIYPIMQWLVKKALESQAETIGYTVGFGVHRFNKQHPQLAEVVPTVDRHLVRRAGERFLTAGVRVPAPTSAHQATEDADIPEPTLQPEREAVAVMLGLGLGEIQQAAQEYGQQTRQLQEAGLDPVYHGRLVAALIERKREAESRMAAVSERYTQLQQKLRELQEKRQDMEREQEQLDSEEQAISTGLEHEQIKTLESITSSFLEADTILAEDAAFKDECKTEYSELQDEIRRLRVEADSLSCGDSEVAGQLREYTASVDQLRTQVAAVSRQVALLQRQMDDVPSRAEIGQYQKRFVELYSQVSSTHKEAKEYYATNNVLSDTLRYLSSELSLLHSVSDSYRQAAGSSSPQNRAEFLTQLDAIVLNVNGNQQKVQQKREVEKRQLDSLNDQLDRLRGLGRTFHATLKMFRDECAANEALVAEPQPS